MDMTSPLLMSVLSGAAAALAVAIMLTVYARSGYRTIREVAQVGVAAVVSLGLLVFVASDMRHAALAYLGINASKPAIEFEIRVPQAILSTMSDTQVELHTDRNQTLARLEGSQDAGNGRGVLRGVVAIDHRTTDRVVVLNLPGRAQCEFKLRLAAEPSRTAQFGPWHLADRVALPLEGGPDEVESRVSFAIRYRVL